MIETVNESVVTIEPKIVMTGEEIIMLPSGTDLDTVINTGVYSLDSSQIVTVRNVDGVVFQSTQSDDYILQYRVSLDNGVNWGGQFTLVNTDALDLKVDKVAGKELALPPAYASIYVADGNTAQTIPTGSNYAKITAYTTNGLNSNCTPDVANDKITITSPGVYNVNYTASYTADVNNVTFRGAVFLGGVEQGGIHSGGQMGLQGAMRSTACGGFVNVITVPVDVDVRIRHDNGGNVAITHVYANLNIKRIG